jgi:phosphopantetheinyl transferase (holo-ACP synthase)
MWLNTTSADPRASATSVWSSKEALAKALGTPLQMDPARLTGPTAWPGASRGSWRATFLDVPSLEDDAVAWVVYESPSPQATY